MRGILFRGKRKDNGKWVYGFLFRSDEGKVFIIVEDCDEEGVLFHKYCEVIPESVGQYTGLRDKNRKRIYEGDIVSIEDKEHGLDKGVVEWFTDFGAWVVRFPSLGRTSFLRGWLPQTARGHLRVKVIGNIHENPEL